jgi:nucleoside phosphorylase
LTANEFEFRAAYEILLDPTKRLVETLGPVYFGLVGNIKVALIVTEMGAKNRLASQYIAEKSISCLKPKTIICLGICFGLKKGKQKLGDLLISKEIQRYSQVRINPDGSKIPRSENRHVDGTLFTLFRDGKNGWTSPQKSVYPVKVQAGIMLSGPELVDNEQRCNELKEWYKEALGGEMEGEGK